MGKGGGGHGGLNILPQKSWHVYNFDAREKVRKDEEAAAAAEAAAGEAATAAERAARHSLLLARAGLRGRDDQPAALGALATGRDQDHSQLTRAGDTLACSGGVSRPPAALPPPPGDSLGFGAGQGAAAPWYARAGASGLSEPLRGASDTLPARVRRERAEVAALRGQVAAPADLSDAPAPAPKRVKSGKRTLDELRAERAARESVERGRAATLFVGSVGGDGSRPAAGADGVEKRYHSAYGHAVARPPRR